MPNVYMEGLPDIAAGSAPCHINKGRARRMKGDYVFAAFGDGP